MSSMGVTCNSTSSCLRFLRLMESQLSLVMALSENLRSEERRVGKECRSRCDWSSDVCSSDLHVEHGRDLQFDFILFALFETHGKSAFPGHGFERELEIGRASCRERV